MDIYIAGGRPALFQLLFEHPLCIAVSWTDSNTYPLICVGLMVELPIFNCCGLWVLGIDDYHKKR